MGQTISSILAESRPSAATFSVEDVPDLTGKVVIVTGSNTGIGKEIVKVLLTRNAKVYMAARTPAKAEAAIKDLRVQTGKQAVFLPLDLANLKSVKASAKEFLRKEDKLHILFNNGGVMFPPIDDLTADGYDLQMGTNVLGHFYFTKLLLPTLIATAQSSPERHVRVVTTGSVLHHRSSGLDFSTFKDSPARRRVGSKGLYDQSKYADLVLATELARRYGDKGIISTCVNPGNIITDLQRHMGCFEYFLFSLILYPISYGILTPLWAGTTANPTDINGKYLVPWARVGTPKEGSQDSTLGKELWGWLEEQVERI